MLHNILQAFAQYKILTVILFAAVVLTVFAWIKALRAARVRSAKRDALLKKLRQEEELRRTFAVITPDLAEQAEPLDMLHGIALRIQKEIENADDLTAAFSALPAVKQHIYALSFVFCEDAQTLSEFFRLNGKPLTTAALDGARASFPPDALTVFEKGYTMFDDEDETLSTLPADVEALDAAFSSLDKPAICDGIRKYIAANAADL